MHVATRRRLLKLLVLGVVERHQLVTVSNNNIGLCGQTAGWVRSKPNGLSSSKVSGQASRTHWAT